MPAPTHTRPRRTRPAGVLAALLGLAVVAGAASPSLIVVRWGDTLSELAVEHGTSVAAIKAANDRSSDTIYAGETLTLPGAPGAGTTNSRIVWTGYTVRSGDTVTGLARRYRTTVGAIAARNDLKRAGHIRVGQQLLVPRTVTTMTPSGPSTAVAASAAAHRAQLARMDLPSKATARAQVARTARAYGVPVWLALAVAYHESGFQQGVVSGVDAIGVMQVIPRTGRNLQDDAGRPLNLLDYRDNITAGVLLLRELGRSQDNIREVLAGYYQGIGSIARQGLLPQTRHYLRTIEALRPRFATQ